MKNNNFLNQKKHKELQKELSFILYKIMQKESLYSCSITNTKISKKGDILELYLTYWNKIEESNVIDLLNKKYLWYIIKQLMSLKKFSYIPHITFFLDKDYL